MIFVNRAIIDLDHAIEKSKLHVPVIRQVHDERVFDLAVTSVERAGDIFTYSMVSAASPAVPLLVDAGIGSNRDETH